MNWYSSLYSFDLKTFYPYEGLKYHLFKNKNILSVPNTVYKYVKMQSLGHKYLLSD